MKTKTQIIQQLLDDRKITAEEAMVLMQAEKEYVYIPANTYPYIPYTPFPNTPNWPYFTTTSGGELTINSN